MLQRLADLAFAVAILVGSIVLWITADKFPISRKYAQIDTDYWPKIVFASLGLLAAALVVQKVLALRNAVTEGEDAGLPDAGNLVRLGITGGLILAYFYAMQWIGFLFATVLFLWAASFVIPYRNLMAKLVFAPAFTVLLTLFFTRALSLPLPRGSGIFYDLSLKLF